MTFVRYAKIWIDDLGRPDISFGFHICWKGRIDLHFMWWIISFGKVPIYEHNKKHFAASNSFDEKYRKRTVDKQAPQLRIASFP
jgi:hypothetical protein